MLLLGVYLLSDPLLGAQKDIRAEVTAEFLAGNVWPPASSNREMYARHLHKKFNFPGGMPEARLMLMKEILTPCDPARNHGSTSRKLPVHRVLRRALPRFHRAVLEAATNGFIECTSSMLKIGWKGAKGQKKNVWQMTAAQAKQCLVGMWWITDDVGREALLAALGSALAKIKGLNGVMIEASESRRRYYKVLYSVHVAVAAKVRDMGPYSASRFVPMAYFAPVHRAMLFPVWVPNWHHTACVSCDPVLTWRACPSALL